MKKLFVLLAFVVMMPQAAVVKDAKKELVCRTKLGEHMSRGEVVDLLNKITVIYECLTKKIYHPGLEDITNLGGNIRIGEGYGPLTKETKIVKDGRHCNDCFEDFKAGDYVEYVETVPYSRTRIFFLMHIECARKRKPAG